MPSAPPKFPGRASRHGGRDQASWRLTYTLFRRGGLAGKPAHQLMDNGGGGAPDAMRLGVEDMGMPASAAELALFQAAVGGVEKERQRHLKNFRDLARIGSEREAFRHHPHHRQNVEAGADAIARQKAGHTDKSGINAGFF